MGLFSLGRARSALPAWAGVGEGDLTRGLVSSDLQPPLLPPREYLDAYTFAAVMDDGAALSVNLAITNLAGTPPRPAFSIHYLPPGGGAKFLTEVELPAEQLKVGGPPLALRVGAYEFRQQADRWRLRLGGAATRGGHGVGPLELDLTLTPTVPGYRRGNGRVPVREGTFFMAVLFADAQLEGTLTVAGKVQALRGRAYGDHSWQDVWAHHIASQWINFRLFSPTCTLALTSWRSPEGVQNAHVLLAQEGKLTTHTAAVEITPTGAKLDAVSGYSVPTRLGVQLGTWGQMELKLGSAVDRQDLLANLPPGVKQFIQWVIAKPYVYRFRTRSELQLHLPGKAPSTCQGEVLADIVFVNEG